MARRGRAGGGGASQVADYRECRERERFTFAETFYQSEICLPLESNYAPKTLSGRVEGNVDGSGVCTSIQIPLGHTASVSACRQQNPAFLNSRHVTREKRTIGIRAQL